MYGLMAVSMGRERRVQPLSLFPPDRAGKLEFTPEQPEQGRANNSALLVVPPFERRREQRGTRIDEREDEEEGERDNIKKGTYVQYTCIREITEKLTSRPLKGWTWSCARGRKSKAYTRKSTQDTHYLIYLPYGQIGSLLSPCHCAIAACMLSLSHAYLKNAHT